MHHGARTSQTSGSKGLLNSKRRLARIRMLDVTASLALPVMYDPEIVIFLIFCVVQLPMASRTQIGGLFEGPLGAADLKTTTPTHLRTTASSDNLSARQMFWTGFQRFKRNGERNDGPSQTSGLQCRDIASWMNQCWDTILPVGTLNISQMLGHRDAFCSFIRCLLAECHPNVGYSSAALGGDR
jgi:hypothetical protein